MTERNAVQLAFDSFGSESGFEKKSGSWYHRSNDVTAVSNLQKSQYGPQYYFNQGFWLRSLGDEPFPKENKCHIRARLESLVPEETIGIDHLLDLAFEMPDQQRTKELTDLLRHRLLPLIELGSTIVGLRSLFDEGAFKAAGVRGPALKLLGVET
jgi:hypothetical protein